MSIKIVEMFFVELCNILYKKYINNCCLVYLKEYQVIYEFQNYCLDKNYQYLFSLCFSFKYQGFFFVVVFFFSDLRFVCKIVINIEKIFNFQENLLNSYCNIICVLFFQQMGR